MAEAQKPLRHHSLQLEDRAVLRATGVSRVDFFSEELITAQTDQGQLHIKGEGLHIENLDSASGELLARGQGGRHLLHGERPGPLLFRQAVQMSGQALPVAVFCLATGAALGCLFLLFQGMSQLLGLKETGRRFGGCAVLLPVRRFVGSCAPCGGQRPPAPVQAALQGLAPGAWWRLLCPLARRGIARLRKIFGSFAPFWADGRASRWGICGKGRPPGPILAKKQEKS